MTDDSQYRQFNMMVIIQIIFFFGISAYIIFAIIFGDHSEYQNTVNTTQDQFLFFSGIEAGMTGYEADEMVKEYGSDWFGAEFAYCANESLGEKYWAGYYDTRDMYMEDGSHFFVEAEFNGTGQVAAIFTHIEFSEKKYDMYSFENKSKSYYNKFVSTFDLWRVEEYVSYDYIFPQLGEKHNFYRSNSLIYNINLHKCHLWLDEFNGVGYAFIEVNNSYKEHNVPVYSIGFVMFMLD